MITRFSTAAASLIVLLTFIGCTGDEDASQLSALDNQLSRLVIQFENAESNFGPSVDSDQLIANAHWVDRMVICNNEVQEIERKAVRLGADPISELRAELQQRVNRHIQTLKSDMHFVDVQTQMEIAKIWLE